MMPKISQYCLFILTLFLPIQTVFATFSTLRLGLPLWVNFWKEALICVICVQLGWQIILHLRNKAKNQAKYWIAGFVDKNTLLELLPLVFIVLATLLVTLNSLIFGEFHSYIFLIGFRFELFWLWFFAILSTWLNIQPASENLQTLHKSLLKSVFLGFSLVLLFIAAQLAFGSQYINNLVGFGSSKNVEYIVSAPSCHVIDFGSDTCRLAGTFSTPNHLAGYLLLILPIFTIGFSKHFRQKSYLKYLYAIGSFLILWLLVQTAARYALLALGIWFLASIIYFLPQNIYKKLFFSVTLLLPLFVALFPIYVGLVTKSPSFEIKNQFLPASIIKPSSTVEHYRNTMASISIFQESPQTLFTGLGLGNSGPAAKSEYQDLYTDNLLFKKYNYISYSWYILPHRITIPESWYIQLLLNGGLVYAIIYILLLLYPAVSLLKHLFSKSKKLSFWQLQFAMGFAAILIGNLFLHLWENQTITIYWSIIWLLSKTHPS
jgi:hypothetical protein